MMLRMDGLKLSAHPAKLIGQLPCCLRWVKPINRSEPGLTTMTKPFGVGEL
jgi:hypothetical protein